MENADYSQVILNKYFGHSKNLLEISLHNGNVISGLLISFFRLPDENKTGSIYAWRFLGENEIADFRISPEKYYVHGRIILQSEISNVDFK